MQILRYTVIPDHVDGLEKGSARMLHILKAKFKFWLMDLSWFKGIF